MSYPDDKEYFRRVINRELPQITGDTVFADDQNNAASFMERLQDTLGYGITMGYADVKEFFDEVQAKIAGLKKTEVIKLHQDNIDELKNPGNHEEYGLSLNLIETDIVVFQAAFNWLQTTSTETYVTMNVDRAASALDAARRDYGTGQNRYMNSPFQYIYINPTPGSATYKLRITQNGAQAIWKNLSFVAIKTSL